MTVLYMLINKGASPVDTKIHAVAPLREIQLLGRLAKADGLTVIAPPVEGRGFSQLGEEELQYLYWNTFGLRPSESYPELITDCLYQTMLLPVNPTPLASLERMCEKLEMGADETPAGESQKKPRAKKEPKEPKARAPKDPTGRPAATSTTGLVWSLADEVYATHTDKDDWKAVSKAVRERCSAEGINPGTVSVQFGKWKKLKLSA